MSLLGRPDVFILLEFLGLLSEGGLESRDLSYDKEEEIKPHSTFAFEGKLLQHLLDHLDALPRLQPLQKLHEGAGVHIVLLGLLLLEHDHIAIEHHQLLQFVTGCTVAVQNDGYDFVYFFGFPCEDFLGD